MNIHQWLHQSLLKKELRQLMPLTIAVVILCMVVVIGIEAFPNTLRSSGITGGYALLLMPSLFAVGAGAMSIGQEKETRTLMWLASLPLPPLTLIRTKAVAAILILALLWIVVFATGFLTERMGLPLQYGADNRHPLQSPWAWHWVLHSFYLLSCGYLAAWWLPTAMAGLVLVAPLSILPTMLRFSIAYVLDPGYAWDSARYDPSWFANVLSVVACLIMALLWVRRFAYASLMPAVSKATANPYAAASVTSVPGKRTSSSVAGPATALLWHFFRQNQWLYLSILGTCVALAVTCLIQKTSRPYDNAISGLTVTVIANCVAASWMGVMVFQGDRVRERMRFLADRGVSPSLVWAIRQLLPLAFIGLMTWLYVLYLQVSRETEDFVYMLPVWIVFGLLLLFYVYGQWFSQLARHPAVSIIGAPVLGFVATLIIVYAAVQVPVPYATLSLFLLAPMLATFAMMKRWMDGRLQWQFWATHVGLIALAVMLPVGWVYITLSQIPRMPVEMRTKFDLFALAQPTVPPPNYLSLIAVRNADDWQFTQTKSKTQALDPASDLKARIDQLKELFKLSSTETLGITIDTEHIYVVLGEIELAKARLQAEKTDQSALKQFQQNFELLMLTAIGLRRTSELIQQDQADACEILMLAYMKQSSTKQWLTNELWTQAVSIVSDREGRAVARKRALVHSWQGLNPKTNDATLQSALGFPGYGYLMPQPSALVPYWTQWAERPRLEHLLSTLMRLLETGDDLSETQRAALLRQAWPLGNGFELEPLRVDDPDEAFSQSVYRLMAPVVPGEQWYAGWEEAGVNLKREN